MNPPGKFDWTQEIRDRDGRVFPFPALDFPDSHRLTVADVAGKLGVDESVVRNFGLTDELHVKGGASDPMATVSLESYRQFIRRRLTCYYVPCPFLPYQLERILSRLSELLRMEVIGRQSITQQQAALFFFPSLDFPAASVVSLNLIALKMSTRIPHWSMPEINAEVHGKRLCAVMVGELSDTPIHYRIPVEAYRDEVRRYFLIQGANISGLPEAFLRTCHREICEHLGFGFRPRRL